MEATTRHKSYTETGTETQTSKCTSDTYIITCTFSLVNIKMSDYEQLSQTYQDTDVQDITTLCQQRRIGMLYNVPPVRFTPTSPYTYNSAGQLNFTSRDLDMRRKAEILKHDKGGSKGNKPTKKEQWSHINSRKYSTRRLLGNAANSVDCATVPTSSRAAGVPGPEITLQLDKSVPLYNYGPPDRTYSSFDDSTDEAFQVVANGEQKTFYHDTYAFLLCLKILDAMDESAKLFTFSLPFSLGYTKNDGVSATQEISGNVFVESPVGGNTTNVTFSGDATNSGTHVFGIDVSNVFFETSAESSVETTVGTIVIENVYVNTQPNFFYEVEQKFAIGTDISLSLVKPCLKINMNNVSVTTN
jgi:hypothetical protein